MLAASSSGTAATHTERTHRDRDELGGRSLPEAVVCCTETGLRPALTEIAHDLAHRRFHSVA